MPKISKLAALEKIDPEAHAAQVRAALEAANGRIDPAAKQLDIGRRQFERVLDNLAKSHPWARLYGQPGSIRCQPGSTEAKARQAAATPKPKAKAKPLEPLQVVRALAQGFLRARPGAPLPVAVIVAQTCEVTGCDAATAIAAAASALELRATGALEPSPQYCPRTDTGQPLASAVLREP